MIGLRRVADRVTPPRRNVELKTRDADPAATFERALALGASDEGVLTQRDTYFARARGRLKLREQAGGSEAGARLIAYVRPDHAEARTSAYRLAEVGDPAALFDALDAALGTLVVVDKRRRLLLYENVRIHLDEVDGLGSFVELEAVADADSDLTREHELVARLREELALGAPVASSYSDLLLDGPAAAARRRRRRHAQRLRPVLAVPRRRRPARRRPGRSTSVPTSRTPPIRRVNAPRRRPSARWSPPERARSAPSPWWPRSSTSARRAAAAASA